MTNSHGNLTRLVWRNDNNNTLTAYAFFPSLNEARKYLYAYLRNPPIEGNSKGYPEFLVGAFPMHAEELHITADRIAWEGRSTIISKGRKFGWPVFVRECDSVSLWAEARTAILLNRGSISYSSIVVRTPLVPMVRQDARTLQSQLEKASIGLLKIRHG